MNNNDFHKYLYRKRKGSYVNSLFNLVNILILFYVIRKKKQNKENVCFTFWIVLTQILLINPFYVKLKMRDNNNNNN